MNSMGEPKKAVVKQPDPPAAEIPTEIIADAIVRLSDGMAQLQRGALNDKALLLLIQHACPSSDRPSTKQIKTILTAVESLKREYLKKPR
jgi:hypothetical protein